MSSIPELWLGTFLAVSLLGQLESRFWIRVLKHLHVLAIGPEGPQAASNLQQVLCGPKSGSQALMLPQTELFIYLFYI